VSPTNHILFLAFSARSHLRILVQFSVNFLLLHPSSINTILVTQVAKTKLDEELALQPASLLRDLEDRFRVIVTPDELTPGSSAIEEVRAFMKGSSSVIRSLMGGKGEGRFAKVPCLVIADVSHLLSSERPAS
jgi:hypothetical protein